MIIKKLSGHEYCQAHIICHDDGTTDLISYSTLVIRVFPSGWLECTGLYSRTTIKHIGYFMRQIGRSYYDAKKAYTDSLFFNPTTGEYKPIDAKNAENIIA